MVNRLIGKRDKKEQRGIRYKYKARSDEAIKKRATQTGGRYDTPFVNGVETYRVNQGDNAFRILPATWDEYDHYGYDIFVHSYVGSNSSTYLCLRKMGKAKTCPICEAAEEAASAGDKEAEKELRVTHRVAMWVIDRQKESEGPKLYSMPWSQDRDIAALCMVKKGKGKSLLIDHPDAGFDVLIQRSGTKFNTRYFGLAIDRESTPISDDQRQQDKWIEYIQDNPIPDILKFYDEEYLRRAIEGTVEAKDKDLDEEEEGDDDRSTRRAKRGSDDDDRRSSRRSSRHEEEDPEDEEQEEGEGDDEGEDEDAVVEEGEEEDPAEDDAEGEEEEDPEEEDQQEPPRRAAKGGRSSRDKDDARPRHARRDGRRDEEDDGGEEEETPRSSKRAPRREEEEPRRPRRDRDEEEPRRQRLTRNSGRDRDDRRDEEEEAPRGRRSR
jgi:hypothetical protein